MKSNNIIKPRLEAMKKSQKLKNNNIKLSNRNLSRKIDKKTLNITNNTKLYKRK